MKHKLRLNHKLRFLLLVASIHCAATVAVALFMIGTSMVLQDIGNGAPTPALRVADGLLSVLAFPWLRPMAEAALRAGNPDPINNTIYWLLPPLNSFFVAWVVTVLRFLVWPWRRRGET